MAASTYYARRSARDPAWRDAQIAGAMEREARRRELDPEGLREARREATRRTRARQVRTGLTFHEIRERCLLDGYPKAERTLRRILAEEIERGTIDFHSTSRRFALNGAIPADVRDALRSLELE